MTNTVTVAREDKHIEVRSIAVTDGKITDVRTLFRFTGKSEWFPIYEVARLISLMKEAEAIGEMLSGRAREELER